MSSHTQATQNQMLIIGSFLIPVPIVAQSLDSFQRLYLYTPNLTSASDSDGIPLRRKKEEGDFLFNDFACEEELTHYRLPGSGSSRMSLAATAAYVRVRG